MKELELRRGQFKCLQSYHWAASQKKHVCFQFSVWITTVTLVLFQLCLFNNVDIIFLDFCCLVSLNKEMVKYTMANSFNRILCNH